MEQNSLIARLIKHENFLKNELADKELYLSVDYSEYLKNRRFRRELERWAENILVSIIDISKIILTLEQVEIPDTYRKIVENIQVVPDFKNISKEIGRFIPLRNIIVHEYLDIKWPRIENFLKSIDILDDFIKILKEYIVKKRRNR